MKKLSILLLSFTFPVLVNAQCPQATAFDYLDINNVKARINNGGDMWWDLIGGAKYIVPKSGNISSLFAGALWIGGIDAQGQLHMAAQMYRQTGNDFFPGPLDENGNITQQTCSDFDRIWKVNKSTIDSFNAGLFSAIPLSILEWPGQGNPNLNFLPFQNLAPFIDLDSDFHYNPAVGDYPAVPGDQTLWFVFNDKGNNHEETGGLPLGIEVRCVCYAVENPSACTYSTTFYHYAIENKSLNDYANFYVGWWIDPDLGCYTDDYIGTDSTQNMGVVYNKDATDSSGCLYNYGSKPPVMGLKILQGPTDENGVTHYMDHSMYFSNGVGGNLATANDYYDVLQSIWPDGSHLTYGKNGHGGSVNSNYFFTGDPSDPNGWSMCVDSSLTFDQRFIVSSGPVKLNAGEIITFDAAAIWEDSSSYPCPSFSEIENVAQCVKDYFDGVIFTGVESPKEAISSIVFPNPSSQNGYITFNLQNTSTLEIFDLTGREVKTFQTNNQKLLQVKTDFGKGVFFFRTLADDYSSRSGKFVVE